MKNVRNFNHGALGDDLDFKVKTPNELCSANRWTCKLNRTVRFGTLIIHVRYLKDQSTQPRFGYRISCVKLALHIEIETSDRFTIESVFLFQFKKMLIVGKTRYMCKTLQNHDHPETFFHTVFRSEKVPYNLVNFKGSVKSIRIRMVLSFRNFSTFVQKRTEELTKTRNIVPIEESTNLIHKQTHLYRWGVICEYICAYSSFKSSS